MNERLNGYINELMAEYDKVSEARQELTDYVLGDSTINHSQFDNLLSSMRKAEHRFCTLFERYVSLVFSNPDFKLVAERRDSNGSES